MKTSNRKVKPYKAYMFVVVAIIMLGCDRNRNHPGWDYFPDMFYSTAYETYSVNPNFRDSMTMRQPVDGTIPRDFVPFGYGPDISERNRAGVELRNPVEPTPDNLERGRIAYDIFCAGCHGHSGTGDGFLFTEGLYPMKPRPVAGKAAAVLTDGEIYHTITLGFGSMGPHGSQVRPDDRWKIILHIRQLQAMIDGAGSQTGN